MRKRIAIVDTNILVESPDIIGESIFSELIVPLIVVEELDDLKSTPGATGYGARRAIRLLELLSQQGDIDTGVANKNGSLVSVSKKLSGLNYIPVDKPDNAIISIASHYSRMYGDRVVLFSNDFNVRLKARACGLQATEWKPKASPALYLGHDSINITTDEIEMLYSRGHITKPLDVNLYPNQYLHMLDSCGRTALGRYCNKSNRVKVINTKSLQSWGIKPRNKEQIYAMDALINPDIAMVSITGEAGTGKTLLALSVALEQTLERHNETYKRILLVKPAVQADKEEKEVGTLPGEKNDKLLPWMSGFTDNLEQLLGDREEVTAMIYPPAGKESKIEIESITQMRGRSLHNIILIIDEAQNVSPETMKMIVTRMGRGSKLVLLGDISQIDHRFLDEENNGLCYLVNNAKETPLSAHVHLSDSSQRSMLAEWGAKNL